MIWNPNCISDWEAFEVVTGHISKWLERCRTNLLWKTSGNHVWNCWLTPSTAELLIRNKKIEGAELHHHQLSPTSTITSNIRIQLLMCSDSREFEKEHPVFSVGGRKWGGRPHQDHFINHPPVITIFIGSMGTPFPVMGSKHMALFYPQYSHFEWTFHVQSFSVQKLLSQHLRLTRRFESE